MSGAVREVSKVFTSLGNVVSSAASFIGKSVESIAKSVSKDPLTAIANVAAIATGNAYLIPIINGTSAAIHGANPLQIAKTVGLSYVGVEAAGFIGEATGLAQAAGESSIAQVGNNVTQGIVRGAVAGADRGSVLDSALAGGLGAGVSSGVNLGLNESGLDLAPGAQNIIANTAGRVAGAGALGRNPEEAAAASLLQGAVNWGGNTIDSTLSALNKVVGVDSSGADSEPLVKTANELDASGNQLRDVANQYTVEQKNNAQLATEYTSLADQYNSNLQPSIERFNNAAGSFNDAINHYKEVASIAERSQNPNDIARANEAYQQYLDQKSNYDSAKSDFEATKDANQDLLARATQTRADFDHSWQKLTDLTNQSSELATKIEEQKEQVAQQYAQWSDEANTKTLENIGKADQGGYQEFSNGSTIVINDDGTRTIADAQGNEATYDQNDQLVSGDPNVVESDEQKNYAAIFGFLRSGASNPRGHRSNVRVPRGAVSVVGLPASRGDGLPLPGANADAQGVQATSASPRVDARHLSPVFAGGFADNYNIYDLLAPKHTTQSVNYDPNNPLKQIQEATGAVNYDPNNPSATFNSPSASTQHSFNPQESLMSQYEQFDNPQNMDYFMAQGGQIPEPSYPFHQTFFSEGGANPQRYVQGDDPGQADTVEAMLSSGEFVIPADCVSILGGGNNAAGAKVLDRLLEVLREHRNEGGTQLPPEPKAISEYLKEAGV